MNESQKERMRAAIAEQIEKTRAELADMEERAQPVSLDEPIGRLSRMDSITNQGVMHQAVQQARTKLQKLQNALERVESDPEFGLCEECGEPINPRRLAAMPESELCINCAE
ncbi:TraR/DksA family transcriptional regulator [Desulfohalovibrio reitneri]|uniref:TraR/DksA family transcriptional regulator n=1 Tax=Desulfohalovibrio reitneri TaxID=1307759 RepID=UPI0004A6EA88|nr:TraR/DksA C4-type zinc finger protein [Desulfohalovibrio reitneri]